MPACAKHISPSSPIQSSAKKPDISIMEDVPPEQPTRAEGSCLEFRDSIQDLYNKDGGHSDDWLPPIYGYMIVNGTAISTPDANTMKSMSRPAKNSFDVSLNLHSTLTDFSSCHFKLYARGLGLEDECVAQILIWIINIQDVQVGYQDTKDALDRFGLAPITIPFGALDKLDLQPGSSKLVGLLETLPGIINSGSLERPTIIEFFLPESTFRLVSKFRTMLLRRQQLERQQSPLARYFSHSPDTRIYTVGHCPVPGDPGFPNNVHGTRITHFATTDQHILYHVAGSVHDAHLKFLAMDELESNSFQAVILDLPHAESNHQFLAVINPQGREALLPQHGEPCKIFFPECRTSSESDEDVEEELQVLVHAFFHNAILPSSTAEDPRQFMLTAAADYLTCELTDNEVEELAMSEAEMESTSDNSAHRDRVESWFRDHPDAWKRPKAENAERPLPDRNESANWWKASRVENPSVYLDPTLQIYLVSRPMGEDGVLGIYPRSIRMPGFNEIATGYFDRLITPDNQQKVFVKRIPSDKALRAEIEAVSSLKHPPSARPRPSQESVQAYQYSMAFVREVEINLLEKIPALGRVVDRSGPDFLVARFDGMNTPMQDTFRAMKSLPAGLHFVPGVAGCGKSFMAESALLFAQYGGCDVDTHPQDALPAPRQYLYVVNNQAAVEEVTERLAKTYDDMGIKNPPGIIRLYPWEDEVRSGMKSCVGENQLELIDTASFEAKHDPGILTGHLSASLALADMTLDVYDTRANARRAKRRNVARSLHAAALQYLEEHEDEHPELQAIIQRVRRGETLSQGEKSTFKARIEVLYLDFIVKFHGIIVTTPVNASSIFLREAFKPDIVVVDEAGTMRELTTLILVAYYSPKAWIITGDITQQPPRLTMEHDLGQGKTTSNPYAEQMMYSLLGRAVEACATGPALVINRRSFGTAMAAASTLFYNGKMRPSLSGEANWPTSLRNIQKYVRGNIYPDLPSNGCSLVVELSGSQSRKVAASQINKMHKTWILDHVKRILGSDLTGLGRNSGKPINILVMAMYKAQVTEFQIAIKHLISQGHISKDTLTRLKVKTLDDSQGDEADIVFVDYVTVSHPGFTAESFRGTLALTRTRGMTILLLNRGTFVGYERRKDFVKRSNHLFRIYNWHASRQLVQRFVELILKHLIRNYPESSLLVLPTQI
ncbi:hypothetical protein CDV31_005368 [Fusarium ambrosium]|uniref:DNA2/NAM7 helicase-like C-terminal domain-containing protein n=1 Tax=Fusarium ambrosium TaxID=131363 RepID=A0A428UJL8_9HYPO|nr:hypothetical protein CDV31_005368 [Fusarium ambrosium]